MTLKALRKMTPARDRDCEALRPSPQRNPDRAGYTFYLATTLDELRHACRPHGEAMVQEAIWRAVEKWLHRDWDCCELSNSPEVAGVAVSLCRENMRARLRYPTKDRRPWPDTLSKMSAQSQTEARLIGDKTIKDWERAGRPFLSPAEIKWAHSYYLQCKKAKRT